MDGAFRREISLGGRETIPGRRSNIPVRRGYTPVLPSTIYNTEEGPIVT